MNVSRVDRLPAWRLVVTSVIVLTAGAVMGAQDSRPTSRITGRVVHQSTQRPLDNVLITLTAFQGPSTLSTLSDSDGVFHFEAVPFGRHAIKAAKAGYALPAWTVGRPSQVVVSSTQTEAPVHLVLVKGAVVAGVVSASPDRPAAAVAMILTRCQGLAECSPTAGAVVATTTTDGEGRFRFFGLRAGSYALAAGGDLPIGTVPTYFPGTSDPARAGFIELREEEERGDVRLMIERGMALRISGVVLDAEGRPARVPLQLFPALRTPARLPLGIVTVDDRGHFTTGPLMPSAYRLGSWIGSGDGSPMQWIVETVFVAHQNVDGLRLQLASAGRLSGRVTPDLSVPDALRVVDGIRVELRRADTPVRISTFDVASGISNERGQFQIADVIPGRYHVSCFVPPDRGVAVAAILAGKRDVLDYAMEVTPLGNEPLNVVLTSRYSLVIGEVRTADGRPAPHWSVVAFSDDPAYWRPESRRVVVTGLAPDGTFEIRALPPGNYLLGLVGIDGPDDLSRPLLEQVATVAHKFALAETGVYRVSLTAAAR